MRKTDLSSHRYAAEGQRRDAEDRVLVRRKHGEVEFVKYNEVDYMDVSRACGLWLPR